jgi:hypothetical protein
MDAPGFPSSGQVDGYRSQRDALDNRRKVRFQMIGASRIILTLLAIFCGAGSALAQEASDSMKLQPMNFDMWCQETQKLPPSRCDQRRPADDAAFQIFSNYIETYEIRNLRATERTREINRDIVHYDPIDHPTEFSAPQTSQPNRGD